MFIVIVGKYTLEPMGKDGWNDITTVNKTMVDSWLCGDAQENWIDVS